MADYRVGFADLTEEVSDRTLPVEGEIPAWLSGRLLRNGPARWTTETAVADHWFDGLAHLTRFTFEGGDVTYSNRFLRTDAYEQAVEGDSFAGQFSSSANYFERLRSLLAGESTDNANVHVARFDDDYVALTETPNWQRFDPDSLANEGAAEFRDDLDPHHITAHLRRDDEAGETWGYFVRFGYRNEYVVFRVRDGSRRREAVARFGVDRPAYMHSFALTEHHVVLVEPPLVTEPTRFLLPGSGGFIDNYDWVQRRGTRFLVFERESGKRVARATTDAFFTFHTANAFEVDSGDAESADTELVVDLVAYDDDRAVQDLTMAALREGRGAESGFPTGELRRYRLPLDSGGVATETLARDVEMPRFSPRVHMRSYRYVFAQSTAVEDGNALTRVDLETGEERQWAESGVFTGEPVFVPRPGAGPVEDSANEADGVVLSLCVDSDDEESFLLVTDGELTELARAPLPHLVPFGFHGEFFTADDG
jgi:carotenoid cleavage dioxygenase-like enzyme